MELVARELAWLLGVPLSDVLVRIRGKDQRRLSRTERAHNLEGRVEAMADVGGMRLLLIDDVITTGASIRSCAQALLDRGAVSVTACALGRVW